MACNYHVSQRQEEAEESFSDFGQKSWDIGKEDELWRAGGIVGCDRRMHIEYLVPKKPYQSKRTANITWNMVPSSEKPLQQTLEADGKIL